MEVSQKIKNGTTIQFSNSTPLYISEKNKAKHYFEKIHTFQCS